MPFCSNCGKELTGEIKFCPECGTSAGAYRSGSPKREYSYEGKLHKCPRCGEMVNSFLTNCPLCGHEFRNSEGSISVKKLAEMLDEIEKERSKEPFSIKKALVSHTVVSNIDERKITLIKNYPIPNTKEDIYEFFILAASNVNAQRHDVENNQLTEAEKALSDAWEVMFNNAYRKAKILLNDTPELEAITSLYQEKCNEILREKKSGRNKRAVYYAILLVMLAFIWIYFVIPSFAS